MNCDPYGGKLSGSCPDSRSRAVGDQFQLLGKPTPPFLACRVVCDLQESMNGFSDAARVSGQGLQPSDRKEDPLAGAMPRGKSPPVAGVDLRPSLLKGRDREEQFLLRLGPSTQGDDRCDF